MIRINPNKILVGGDKTKAKEFIGQANSQMEILIQDMSFQKLFQGSRQVWLYDDVLVECRKIGDFQECRIWVRPVEENEAEGITAPIFYVRIKHLGVVELGNFQELMIDRIIVWDPDKTNIGDLPNYDVDVLNEIVYSSVSVETESEQIVKCQGIINRIDAPTGGFSNLVTEWFETTDISDPIGAHKQCTGNPSTYPLTYVAVNEFISGFPHMLPYDGYSGAWQNKYCPSLGGDPMLEYDKYVWREIDANADKYPETKHPEIGIYPDGVYLGDIGVSNTYPNVGRTFGYMTSRPVGDDLNYKKMSGVAYMGKGSFYYPCFFVLFSHDYAARTIAGSWAWKDDFSYIDWNNIDSYVNGRFNFTISLPIESVQYNEIFKTLFISDEGNSCHPASLNCDDNFEGYRYQGFDSNHFTDIEAEMLDGVFFCGVDILVPDSTNAMIQSVSSKVGGLSRSYLDVEINIPDTAEETYDQQYMSFFVMQEKVIEKKAAYAWYVGATLENPLSWYQPSHNEYYNWAAVPSCYNNQGSVLLYILQTDEFFWENVETGETEFLDLHSLREINEGDISKYRILGLEEHLLNIMSGLLENIATKAQADINIYGISSKFLSSRLVTGGHSGLDLGVYPTRSCGYEYSSGFLKG